MFRANQAMQTAPADGGASGGANGAPAANGAAWYGGDGNKAIVEANGFKTVDDVFKWGENAQKLIGTPKERIAVLPKDDKDAEGVKAFRAKIGVPEKADGYATPEPLKDDPLWGPAREAALKHGLPAKAFDGFMADVLAAANESNSKLATELKNASDKALGELRGEWGDKFDANAELARRFVKSGGVSDEELAAIEGAIGTSKFLKMFHSFGERIGEHKPAALDNSGGGGRLSQSQAQEKLKQLNTDRVAGKIDDKAFFVEAERLGKLAYPD